MVDIDSTLAGRGRQLAARAETPSLLSGVAARPFPLRRRLIVGASLLAADVVIAILAAMSTRRPADALSLRGAETDPVVVAALFTPILFLYFGLYSGMGPSPVERLRLRIVGVFLCTVAAMLALLSAPDHLFGGRGLAVVLTSLLLIVLGYYGEALVRGVLIRGGLWGAPAVLVGGGSTSQRLAEALLGNPDWGLQPVGFIETAAQDEANQRMVSLKAYDPGTLPASVEVVLFPSAEDAAGSDLLRDGPLPCARVMVAQDAHAMQSLWLQTRALGGVVAAEVRRDLYLQRNLLLKRIIDCAIAVPAAIVAAPIIGALAVAIKIVDAGPAFYVQNRVGLHGRTIRVLKLRTMYANAEARLEQHLAQDLVARAEWESHYKLQNDPRILPVFGRFMRRSSLDELPQLFNIIRGDMSLVGPRPFPPYHMAAFEGQFRMLRTSVPPGLTGLWQVSARSDGDLAVQQAVDSFYIRNWSVWLDFYVLLQTVLAVLRGKGAK